ncbi:hypothetical protein AACH06_00725 [Ideonella sp. DXS29W]|uniref:Uncharacterized protein n=1 Tax=Ideonella lacteola TaxID=2984193 RepID=A0ABU9BKE7_9BURK
MTMSLSHPIYHRPSQRTSRRACLALAACAAWLAAGCATAPPSTQGATSASGSGRPSLPTRVVDEIARLAGQSPAAIASALLLKEVELAPNGPRAWLVGLGDRGCPDVGCPFGVFAGPGTDHRPLLLVMSHAEPQFSPVGHLGYADVSVSEVASTRELRLTRYQWDGSSYGAAACRLVDRVSSEARPCAPRLPSEATLLDALPDGCAGVKEMLAAPPSALRTQALLSGSFVVRSDESSHVEALKIKGMVDSNAVSPMLRCLRDAGADLKRGATSTAGALKVQQWSAPAQTHWGRAAVLLTHTQVPRLAYTIVSVGVFTSGERLEPNVPLIRPGE